MTKILVVDDLAENVDAIVALLEEDGVDAIGASNGAGALAVLNEHDVALALVDVAMPGMDGFALAERMRDDERLRAVPIIFMSGSGHDPRRVFRGYDAGAVDYLVKPVEHHILRSKVAVFVELARQKQQLALQVEQLKKANEERDALLVSLKETLTLNELFVGVVGHDLRSPVSAILTAAALLESSDEPTVKKVSMRLRSVGSRMSRMINDLLDLTRARLGGGIPVRREQLDLAPVVGAIVDESRLAWPNRVFELTITGSAVLDVDGDRVAQATMNLVQNAAVHGKSGTGVKVVVDGAGADAVVVEVKNDGVLPGNDLQHLFDPFARGKQTGGGSRTPGLGLGLFIVDQIVRAHAGVTEVVSGDGTTTFRLVLPRKKTSSTAATPSTTSVSSAC